MAFCRLLTVIVVVGAITPTAATVQELKGRSGPVYIVYAGPHASSPPSAFGHLFLAIPADSLEPPPLWDVVTFVAHTEGAGPLRFLGAGIAGGFLGRYERRDFHYKARDYQLLDDRDLWLTELRLNPSERLALETELAATEGRWYPYTFFGRNCAYYLQVLLARATDAIPPPSGITSPTGVMDGVRRSRLAGPSYFRPARSRKLERLANAVSEAVLEKLRRTGWSGAVADTAWLATRPRGEYQFVQEYAAWKALQRGSVLSDSVRAGLDYLRFLNAARSTIDQKPTGTPGRAIPSPRFHPYTRVSLGYSGGPVQTERMVVRLRPAAHDLFDRWVGHRPINTLELLTLTLSVPTGHSRIAPRLEEAVLFSQRSLNPSSWLVKRASWMLELVARRGGVTGPTRLNVSLRSGGGYTVQLTEGVYSYGLVTVATLTDGSVAALAPGIEVGFYSIPSPRWRVGLVVRGERSVYEWSKSDSAIKGFVRYDVGMNWGTRLMFERTPHNESNFWVGLDWYP